MTTYIEDWIEAPNLENLGCADYSSQSVLKCNSDIEKEPILFQYNWDLYNSLLKWINLNYSQKEFGLYQSWNPKLTSLFGDQVVTSFFDLDNIINDDFYIKPIPIKSFDLKVKIISKSKGTPKIYPID